MKWTSELPTEPGWYWVRNSTTKHKNIVLVFDGLVAGNYTCLKVEEAHEIYGEWAGPIPEPEE